MSIGCLDAVTTADLATPVHVETAAGSEVLGTAWTSVFAGGAVRVGTVLEVDSGCLTRGENQVAEVVPAASEGLGRTADASLMVAPQTDGSVAPER